MLNPIKAGLVLMLAASTISLAESDLITLPYGVTRAGTILNSEVHPSLLDVHSPLTRILLIASPAEASDTAGATATLLKTIAVVSANWSTRYPHVSVSVIVAPYPDRLGTTAAFPPAGKAYDDPNHPEAIYLWRWIGMLAPDVVVEIGCGPATLWAKPVSDQMAFDFARSLLPEREAPSGSLATALATHAPGEVGTIPALSLRAVAETDLLPLLEVLQKQPLRSPARNELLARQNRSPLQVAQALSRTYGHQLDEVAYIPALALMERLRLADLTGDASHLRDVERIVQPYHSREKPSLPAQSSQSQQAGHLIFGALAARTNDPRYIELLRQPAELGFDQHGQMLEAMPAHSEMSDAVFLGTPLLAQTARLTGDQKYREMALRHLRFMVKMNRRPDGLHQHSPLDPEHTAWGRGNGFVTLGLILTLSELPEGGAEFAEVMGIFREHVGAMIPHQDALGMWHQVIDHPGSYREFTVTCMTTFAIARGIRRGWLDREHFEPLVRRAWQSIKQRTSIEGGFVDVCTGTGKMNSLREYLDRPAILGRDDRGGAMALLVSTELAYAEREKKLSLE